ncbi:MAG: hypothetical protein IKT50_04175 [Clostridia bacterium]|nr:hypothetical protein [Clostridia bacterium]
MRQETIRFESYELTSGGFVRTGTIMRHMQQAAREDLLSFGISYEDMRKKNMAFVISRMAIRFERPVYGERPLILKTGPNPVHGVTFPRSFVLEDDHGICMRAMSLWALLDFEKRSLLRPSALWKELPCSEDFSDGVGCERLVTPRGVDPDYTDTRRVYSSMLDQNDHLNNCNYADLATDLLPKGRDLVREIHIAFQHEARLGEVLKMEGYESEDGCFVSGSFADREENCFLCKIKNF